MCRGARRQRLVSPHSPARAPRTARARRATHRAPRCEPARPRRAHGAYARARYPCAGAVITCVIEVEQQICVETFDACAQLGRFTLRDEGKTIGIGKILKLLDMPSSDAKAD